MPLPIAAIIAAGASVASSAISAGVNRANRNEQRRINEYNTNVNQRNLKTQMAYNSANALSQREYDSPLEQKRRLAEAGVNPYTANDMLASDTGISSSSISPSSSSAVAHQSSFNISDVVNALGLFSQNEFTKEMSKFDAKNVRDNLIETLNNQIKLKNLEIDASRMSQQASFLHDLEMLKRGQQHETSERLGAENFMKEFETLKNNYAKDLLKLGHENSVDILTKSNRFTLDRDQQQFIYDTKKQKIYHHYDTKAYEVKRDIDMQYEEYEGDISAKIPGGFAGSSLRGKGIYKVRKRDNPNRF